MLGNPYGGDCTDSCMLQEFQRALNVDKAAAPPAKLFHEMPRPTSFGKDTGLQVRMTLTMFLLGAVYVALVVVLLQFISSAFFVIVIAGGLAALNLFASDKLALAAMGGRVVSPQQAPQLHAMVERLCVQADLPKPKVAVANTSMPNAFALGRSPKKATVCATTGIMDLLTPAELEGVIAHELTHVANRDVMVMTLASFFATIAAYIVQFGFFFGGTSSSDDDDNPSFFVLLLVSLAVYVVSFLLMQALSRYREFAADRGAALITGRPSALASALVKISGGMARIPQRDLRAASQLNAFFIFPAGVGKGIGSLFATHPPMEKRIAALQRLEAQLQGTA
jgi:heat shock protein HtpX